MTFVREANGFGAHHWSRSSAFVYASQTRSRDASNSFVIVTVFVGLSIMYSIFILTNVVLVFLCVFTSWREGFPAETQRLPSSTFHLFFFHDLEHLA